MMASERMRYGSAYYVRVRAITSLDCVPAILDIILLLYIIKKYIVWPFGQHKNRVTTRWVLHPSCHSYDIIVLLLQYMRMYTLSNGIILKTLNVFYHKKKISTRRYNLWYQSHIRMKSYKLNGQNCVSSAL